jgi:hypothetical protein
VTGRTPQLDSSGLPFHEDDAAVIKEGLFVDKADPDLMLDEITVIDHAMTRPWAATRGYPRNPFENDGADDDAAIA